MNSLVPTAVIDIQYRVDFVTISTIDDFGFPDSRLLFNLKKMKADLFKKNNLLENTFSTYLGTNTSSAKIKQIINNQNACIYYCDYSTFEGLTVKGYLEEVHDNRIKDILWDDTWEKYYYGGKDGGDYSIVEFIPLKAKYYHGLKTLEINCK